MPGSNLSLQCTHEQQHTVMRNAASVLQMCTDCISVAMATLIGCVHWPHSSYDPPLPWVVAGPVGAEEPMPLAEPPPILLPCAASSPGFAACAAELPTPPE